MISLRVTGSRAAAMAAAMQRLSEKKPSPSFRFVSGNESSDIFLHTGDVSDLSASGKHWALVWDDGRPFDNLSGSIAAACHPRHVLAFHLIEKTAAGWMIRADGAFAVIPGNVAATRDVAEDRAARLVLQALDASHAASALTRPITPAAGMQACVAVRCPVTRLRLIGRRIADLATRLLLHENWMIGWVDAPIAESIHWTKCPPVTWIGARSEERYLADPFAWPDQPDIVFCEEYPFDKRQGALKRLDLDGARIRRESAAAFPNLPGHLSFPFLFKQDGEIYCMPESAAAGRLGIFRWHGDKDGWREIATPLQNTAAADAILFAHDGLFWIAYTDISIDPFDNLHLCHAPQLTGPWTPHAGNPVRLDPRNARCGGTPFRHDGKLYRPAQDCTSCYGAAIRIMEITACTPERFEEREIAVIAPPPGDNPHGFHTLSAWGETRCLIDAKRMVFRLSDVAGKIRRVLESRL